MVQLPVIKACTHDGRAYGVGERITVSPLEALALCRRGVVSLTRGYRTKPLMATPVVEPVPGRGRRRSYRRRDLAAEPS